MKVKVISRNPRDYMRETKLDIHKVQRNYDPKLHPFEIPREYQRALNSVKLERIFAKPFVGALDGHGDVVTSMLKHPTKLPYLISGACDGVVKLWNIGERKCLQSIKAHNSMVKSLSVSQDGNAFFTIGDDSCIKTWALDPVTIGEKIDQVPLNTIIGHSLILGSDHHWRKPLLVTCGHSVELWDHERSIPLQTFKWGVDSVHSIHFNPVETDVCCSCASDRSIILYDIRKSKPLRKVVLEMRTNTVSWNPMEAFIFTAANEDNNLYTFDMRNLTKALVVHKDHVSAVIDVDFSPTGKEFVSGSYDKTIRLFQSDKAKSYEIYHTKRMQRITNVKWSLDNKYILSASDEMDIRIWKASASEKIGQKLSREENAFKYQEKLKRKFENHPEIKRIARHRHVPKHIKHGQAEKRLMIESRNKKEANRRAHSKQDNSSRLTEKERYIVREDE